MRERNETGKREVKITVNERSREENALDQQLRKATRKSYNPKNPQIIQSKANVQSGRELGQLRTRKVEYDQDNDKGND